jgi:hypothetical protein
MSAPLSDLHPYEFGDTSTHDSWVKYCWTLGYAKKYQTFSTALTTLRMYFKFYIVVDRCIFYRMMILVFCSEWC